MPSLLGVAFVAVSCTCGIVAQDAPVQVSEPADTAPLAAPAPDTVEHSWPRVLTIGNGSVTVYPPTLNSWSGTTVTGTCAIAVAAADGRSQTYGTMAFSADTEVNKLNRVVELSNIQVKGVSLPENPAGQGAIGSEVESRSKGRVVRVALDRFEAAVPQMSTAPAVPSAPLRNDAPAISIVTTPTVLVPIQGQPVAAAFQGTGFKRVMNTPMLLMQGPSGSYWLKIADGWMTSPQLGGPWTVARSVDPVLDSAASWARSQPSINLLAPGAPTADAGSAGAQTASLAGSAPAIVVSTSPTEVLVVDGTPAWQPLGSSGLLYVSNTSANIFQLRSSMAMYVLASGRWFTASSQDGPWTFVPPDQLPAAFMMIPHDSPKENVLASIPGSAQAQEAAIANSVPQMARVPQTQAMPLPEVAGGTPKWVRISGTSVDVLRNCQTPVFRLTGGALYSVVNGVWFTAPAISGAWKVAAFVPPDIYMIPPSSPYYFVTFVRVYNATPEYVLCGYTPGYFGAYTQGGVVVYGTGYEYAAYCDDVWVPVPMTYGCGAAMCYNPWAGWAFGFGMGMAVGWAVAGDDWHYGPYPCWGAYYGGFGPHGAYAWGPGGWAATTGNCYHHWGDVTTMSRTSAGYNAWTGNAWATHTATAYNSATGARAAGQRGYVENAYTGNWAEGARGAGYNPTTGNYASGRGVVAGDSRGADVAAGTATVGNTKTGESATVSGVKTDNGSWGVARTDNGTAVEHNGNVYGMQDGNAYRYNGSSSSWEQYNGGSWNAVRDDQTVRALDSQAAARNDGDWRAQNASRWQSGGEGYAGSRSADRSTYGGNWGGGGASGGRFARSGGGGRGGRR